MGGVNLQKLVFDTSNQSDSANVGAYVKASDGTLITKTTVGGKEALDVNVANTLSINVPNTAGAYSNISVGLTAVNLFPSPLANRKKILIQNLGPNTIYIGFDNLVTTSNGIKIPREGNWAEEIGPDIDIYAIGSAAAQDVRVMELS